MIVDYMDYPNDPNLIKRSFFMKHIIAGLFAIGLGIWGLAVWWTTFGMVMRGIAPFFLLAFGLMGIASGLRRLLSKKKVVE